MGQREETMNIHEAKPAAVAVAPAEQDILAGALVSEDRESVGAKIGEALALGQKVIHFTAPKGASAVEAAGKIVKERLNQPLVVINGEDAWQITFNAPKSQSSTESPGLFSQRIAQGRVIVINSADELTTKQNEIVRQFCKAMNEGASQFALSDGSAKMQVCISPDTRLILRHTGLWACTPAPTER
jgi:hypothetical protein